MGAVGRFLSWCEEGGLDLRTVEPLAVAAYIEHHPGFPQTVRRHLTAIRRLFNRLVEGKVLPENPVEDVRDRATAPGKARRRCSPERRRERSWRASASLT